MGAMATLALTDLLYFFYASYFFRSLNLFYLKKSLLTIGPVFGVHY